jgi:hypothetical protein
MTGTTNLRIGLTMCLLLPALVRTATGTTFHTNPTWGIQVFVDTANSGDQIEAAPGTYGAINFKGKAIRVYSSGGPGVTFIQGWGVNGPLVQCVNGEGSGTILEGFTVTGGHAADGGGMYIEDSSPTVTNCTFSGNSAADGAGMYNGGGSPTVTNCTFSGNSADWSGAGMYNAGGSPTVTDCTFSDNSTSSSANRNGGGMCNWGSNPTVTNCAFTANSAYYYGGGMYNYGSIPTVTNCTFSGNSGRWGGGMCNDASSPTVTNCAFRDNSGWYGGGMYNYSSSNPTVTNCTFWRNSALTNIAGENTGGGIYTESGSPKVTNCILWNDKGGEIHGTGNVTYSDVQDGWGGTNNINIDPQFADADGRLLPSSPCVDGGDDGAVNVAADLDGNPRIADGDLDGISVVDMGAYETPGPLYVPADYPTIQSAIDAATAGYEIVVALGTYNEAINFHGKAIRLCSSAGPGMTIIDASGLNASVVTCNSGEGGDTILEGFTVTGGNASNGGGMYNTGSSPTVTNCIFTANTASRGGGMLNNQSDPTVTDCTFSGNSAGQSGGGMYNDTGSSPTVTDCTFTGNTALAYNGGGMYSCAESDPTVTDCIFTSNEAGSYGGGMHSSGCTPTVTNCTFNGNTAGQWGAGMSHYASSPTVTDCTFSGNWALESGGGMCNDGASSPIVTNCTFTGNTAVTYHGGGMYSRAGGNPTVTNCIFIHNHASYYGGAMHSSGCSPTVTNCTFTGNTAVTSGGGMYNYDSSPAVTNCILWADSPSEMAGTAATVTYSDVQLGSGTWPGVGNINAGPMFADADGRLLPGSPCIDAGNNEAIQGFETDLDGNGRIVSGTVDMGAYEFQTKAIHNVTQGHWYGTIQAAIDTANPADQIEVNPGTYDEAVNFHGKPIRLYSLDGPGATTINGAGAYHVVQCVSGEGAGTILEGFTITGGNANGASSPENCGGGMLNSNSSSPTVIDCSFSANTAAWSGGGMYNTDGSSPTVTNCTFSENMAVTYHGGGMYSRVESNPTVTDCIFTNNQAGSYGGGMHSSGCAPAVTNCTFTGNTAGQWGGGMCDYVSSPTVTNCTLSGNSALHGGAMYNYDSSPTVTNCILWADLPNEIEGTPATVTYSDVQGGTGQAWFGVGCIDSDPRFADADGRLAADSPCIDAGSNAALPEGVTTDRDGNPRIFNDIVDMGAYESQYVPIAVDDRVIVSLGSTRYDLQTMQTSVQMTITNTSATAISGPVWVVIPSISELAVTLTDATGTTSEGYSYVDVTALLGDGSLAPGEEIAVRLAFNNPDRLRFTFASSIRGVLPPE